MKTPYRQLLAGFALFNCLHAQEPDRAAAAHGGSGLGASDPFVRGGAGRAEEPAPPFVPKVLSVCFESFSLDIAAAAEIYHGMPNDTQLYKEIAARLAKGEAKQEVFSVIRARSGEKATVESISEYIYPAEYEPAQLPNTVGLNISPSKPEVDGGPPPSVPDTGELANAPAAEELGKLSTPATPSSFETRNTGFTLEIEPTLGHDDQTIDLRLAPDLITLAERTKWGQGDSEAELPNFETQRLMTASTLIAGQPQLIGTPSKPPVSKIDPDSANRIWFAFVTVKVVSVVKE